LERIVLKALARDVGARYQYASELAEDLKPFCASDGAVFGPKSLAQYLQAAFAEDLEREKQRMATYAAARPPGSPEPH
jgi:hypothetical protein